VTHERSSGDHPDTAGGLFLVEFASADAGEAEEMHAAFQHAVLRLRGTGAPIRWRAGWLVPADERCLCLVEAPDESVVVLARDTAALALAPVRRVRPLPARTPPSSPIGSRS
jgi:hypothetical protein